MSTLSTYKEREAVNREIRGNREYMYYLIRLFAGAHTRTREECCREDSEMDGQARIRSAMILVIDDKLQELENIERCEE